MKWFALYTKPNYEKKVSQGLNNLGIESYCPTFTTIKQYSDRKKKIEKVLLPGYVLVFIDDYNRSLVFSIPGIIRYVFWLGKPAEIRPLEIEIMKKNLNGIFDNVSFDNLKKGSDYIIKEGPFKGNSGVIIETEKNKLKLAINSMGVMVTLTRRAA